MISRRKNTAKQQVVNLFDQNKIVDHRVQYMRNSSRRKKRQRSTAFDYRLSFDGECYGTLIAIASLLLALVRVGSKTNSRMNWKKE
jgi:hypothetical protein